MTKEELLQLIDSSAAEGQTELDLAGLELEELPPEIGKCTQLETLVLGKWDEEKREWIGNKLTEFPDVVLQLTNLKILYLSNNQITVIPEAIAQLSNLTLLYLSNNQITVIPEAIAQLSNLTQLNLWNNQITVIPEAIAQLSNLTELYLSNNQITVIPEAIRCMEKLEKLDLRGNPLPIPPEILQGEKSYEAGDLRTILDFYFQTRNPDDCEELYEAKLLIVGEGVAGKTTLAKKLLNPDYQLPEQEQEPSTEGIDVLRWKFPHNGKTFRVHIWDFGGQEIYHATHQFFLTERSFYILLTEDSSETNNFQNAFQGANFSGNIGGSSNTAQVSGNQSVHNNNANTAELLKLISSMRQTAAQFPEDEREEVLMEIGNVEAQLNKPADKRSLKLIAKKLAVILAIAAGIASPIANITDFTNNVTDLAQKAGVEIPMRSAR